MLCYYRYTYILCTFCSYSIRAINIRGRNKSLQNTTLPSTVTGVVRSASTVIIRLNIVDSLTARDYKQSDLDFPSVSLSIGYRKILSGQ